MDYHQVAQTTYSEPHPSGGRIVGECPKYSSTEHDAVCCDRDQKLRAWKPRKEGETRQKQWGCQKPVDITEPEHLAEVVLVRVDAMFVGMFNCLVFPGYAFSCGKGEIGYEGDGGYKGDEGVEDAF